MIPALLFELTAAEAPVVAPGPTIAVGALYYGQAYDGRLFLGQLWVRGRTVTATPASGWTRIPRASGTWTEL